MKERPILFSGPMVMAILEGRKTQTRRVIKTNGPTFWEHGAYRPREMEEGDVWTFEDRETGLYAPTAPKFSCPYGKRGDRLWVRETFQRCPHCSAVNYAATVNRPKQCSACDESLGKWKPAIYMPRSASRITLETTKVRVERVQDISEEDAISEGISKLTKDGEAFKYAVLDRGDISSTPWAEMQRTAVDAFASLWNSINESRGFGWAVNPWVFPIEFKRL